jgi:hypothetical protein
MRYYAWATQSDCTDRSDPIYFGRTPTDERAHDNGPVQSRLRALADHACG